MKLKKFRIRYCIAPERAEQYLEVTCTDKEAAKCIVKHLVEGSSAFPRHADIHAVNEITG